MPTRCCVPICKGNYPTGPKVSIFAFPKDENLMREWLQVIQRKVFFPNKNSKVCELHFKPDDIIREASAFDEKTGRTISASLMVPRLSPKAVPSQFPVATGYKPRKKKRIQETTPESTFDSKLQVQAKNNPSGVQGQAESILPDIPVVPDLPIVPNLDIVKKEPIDYSEESLPFASQNIPIVQNSSRLTLSLKLEPPDDCEYDMTPVPVNPDDIALPASINTGESSSTSTSHTCSDSVEPSKMSNISLQPSTSNTEPPSKIPNLSQSSSTSNTEIKDEFCIFGDFVAAKIRSFTNRHLQVEAQHIITNMLFDMEMKNLNEDNLPVISKISSVQNPPPATVTLPSSSNISGISSLQTQLPPSSAIKEISSLQTQIPVTVTLPSSSAVSISKLQKPLSGTVRLPSSSAVSISKLQKPLSGTVRLPSSSSVSRTSNLKTKLSTNVTLPSNSARSRITSLQTELPATVTLPTSSTISRITSLQTELPVTVTLPTSSPTGRNSSLQTPSPVTSTLPSISVIPVTIPVTPAHTITLNTQVVRPGEPKV